MTSPIRRVLFAAVSAIALVVVAGCAAGQIAETAEEVSAVNGSEGGIGPIQLRNVTLAFPAGGVYRAGSDARVEFAAVNEANKPERLVNVSSTAARGSQAPSVAIGPQSILTASGNGPEVRLTGLTTELRASQTVPVTFTFASAGRVTLQVPVATPIAHIPGTSAP